jgi:hypothetical protein
MNRLMGRRGRSVVLQAVLFAALLSAVAFGIQAVAGRSPSRP